MASSRIRPLTRLVGKFSKSKVSPKKKFAGAGGLIFYLDEVSTQGGLCTVVYPHQQFNNNWKTHELTRTGIIQSLKRREGEMTTKNITGNDVMIDHRK